MGVLFRRPGFTRSKATATRPLATNRKSVKTDILMSALATIQYQLNVLLVDCFLVFRALTYPTYCKYVHHQQHYLSPFTLHLLFLSLPILLLSDIVQCLFSTSMRSFAILLSLQCIYNGGVVGFSPTVPTMTTSSPSSTSSLFAINDYDDISLKNTNKVDYHHPLHNKIAKITATLALGLTIGTSSGIAYDNNNYSPNNAEIVSSASMMTSSSVQLSASYSNSDFADFSLPSYQDVTAADVNSNLSGGKDLLGDEFKTFRYGYICKCIIYISINI